MATTQSDASTRISYRQQGQWQDVFQDFVTIVKNSIEIRRDEQFLNQLSSRYCVDHVIAREGSAFLLGKGVLMNPQSVGASGLLVDQACGRFPNYDLVLPTNR